MDKKPRIRPRLDGLLRNEDGVMAVVFAMCLPVFLVCAALAIDMGYAYWKRNIVQVDASVSALAGAGIAMDDGKVDIDGTITYTLIDKAPADGAPDSDDSDADGVIDGAVILIEALAYAEKTIVGEDILAAVDVLPGNWEPTTRVFTRAGTWDAVTLMFTTDPAAYDTATGIWTPVADPIVPLNAVMTTTRRADDGPNNNPLPLFLAAAVGMPEVNINTSAIATIDVGDPIALTGCITALNDEDPPKEATFYINGTALVEAPGCDINVYSEAICALDAKGNPDLTVLDANLGGAINVGGIACETANVNIDPTPTDYYDKFVEDPYGYLQPLASCLGEVTEYCNLNLVTTGGACTAATAVEQNFTLAVDEVFTLPNGEYCGGFRISGASGSKVIFDGIYVIRFGELDVASSVAMESTEALALSGGVGFYLMDGARVNLHGSPGGSAAIGLQAQMYGPLKDFVFFEDPYNDIEPFSHSLRGTPLGAIDGIMFFQESDVEFKGTADALFPLTPGDGCTILIADEIYFNGTTQFSADMGGCAARDIPDAALGEMALRLRN